MPTYISLINFTQKGVETIKEGGKRIDAARQAFRAWSGEAMTTASELHEVVRVSA